MSIPYQLDREFITSDPQQVIYKQIRAKSRGVRDDLQTVRRLNTGRFQNTTAAHKSKAFSLYLFSNYSLLLTPSPISNTFNCFTLYRWQKTSGRQKESNSSSWPQCLVKCLTQTLNLLNCKWAAFNSFYFPINCSYKSLPGTVLDTRLQCFAAFMKAICKASV